MKSYAKHSIILLFNIACIFWPGSVTGQPRETSSCDGRRTPGPICESCELLSTCVLHSSGWVNIPVETCDTQKGFYCNARLGTCSNMTGPCHPFAAESNFPCTSHGVFPDVYDCQKYHMCYFVGPTLISATVDCEENRAFDVVTGKCTLPLNDPACTKPQYQCLTAGEAHAWPNSPNIFYICKALLSQDERVLYPTLYRCVDGEVFDGYYCSKAVSVVTTTVATHSEGRCTEVGLSLDTQDCNSYYYCSAVNSIRRHYKCPLGTYFNTSFAYCTLGSCTN